MKNIKNELSLREKEDLYYYETTSWIKEFIDKIDENINHPRIFLENIIFDNGWMSESQYSVIKNQMSVHLHGLCSSGILWDNLDGTLKVSNLK